MSKLSKEEKKKMKSFRLENRLQFEVYLRELITRTHKCLTKEKMYLERLSKYIGEKKLEKIGLETKDIVIKYLDYSEFLSLLSGVEAYAVNIVGDNQSISMSYKKFRDIICKRKNKGTIDFALPDLSEDEQSSLNHICMLRNFLNHIPESLLMSELKLIEEGKLRDHGSNPIEVFYNEYCTLEYAEDLFNQSNQLYHGIKKMHQCMKRDYSSIIGESVQVNRIYISKPTTIDHLEIGKLSSEVQGLSN